MVVKVINALHAIQVKIANNQVVVVFARMDFIKMDQMLYALLVIIHV